MIWTKKIRAFKELLAESLEGRLKIHTAGYRRDSYRHGRTWIEFDQGTLVSFTDYRLREDVERQQSRQKTVEAGAPWPEPGPRDVYSKDDFGRALGWYLNADFDEARESENAIVRALSYLDRRLGKRRLQRFRDGEEEERGLPRIFLETRLRAEGMWREEMNS
jgi:hypothetical protein